MNAISKLLDDIKMQHGIVDETKIRLDAAQSNLASQTALLARTKTALKISSGVIIACKTRVNDLKGMIANATTSQKRYTMQLDTLNHIKPSQAYEDYQTLSLAFDKASSRDRLYLAMELQAMRKLPDVIAYDSVIFERKETAQHIAACIENLSLYNEAIISFSDTIEHEIIKQKGLNNSIRGLNFRVADAAQALDASKAAYIQAYRRLTLLKEEAELTKAHLQDNPESLQAYLKAMENKRKARAGNANKKAQKVLSDKAKRETCTVWVKGSTNPLNMDSVAKKAHVPYQKLYDIPVSKTQKANVKRGKITDPGTKPNKVYTLA